MISVIRQKETNPAKVWLRGYRCEKLRMESLIREIDDLSEASQRATSKLTATRLSGTGSHGGFEGTVIRKTDAEKELQKIIEHIHEYLLAREEMVSRLSDPRQRKLLTLRYFEGKRWDQVEYLMGYEKAQVHRIHGDALNEINRLLKHDTK